MNFGGFIGLTKKGERDSSDIHDEIDMQNDMANALEESMTDFSDVDFDLQSSADGDGDDAAREDATAAAEATQQQSVQEKPLEVVSKLTSHTRNRLAALDTFERLYGTAAEHLQQIASRMTEVKTLHGSIGELITILHSEIHRGNELELSNAAVLAEHRKLWEQFQDSSRHHQERETVLDRLQQRETMLLQDSENLRSQLATAKLEMVEATNKASKTETELEEARKVLTSRAAEAERRTRENDGLRERNISLSIDYDKAQKREAELRHRLDEITKIHDNEAQRNGDLLTALARSEKEALKLQSALDAALSRQSEMDESLRVMEAERDAEAERNRAETRALRMEVQGMQSRLQGAAEQHASVTHEIADLKSRLNDASAERHVLTEKLVALARESDTDRTRLTAANATISEMTLRQASEQIQLEVRIQECEDLKLEIAELNAQIKELLPYERLHRVTQARQNAIGVVDFPAMTASVKQPAVVVRRSDIEKRG